MIKLYFSLVTVTTTLFFSSLSLAQHDVFDFENYISGQQLVCQDSVNWMTWSQLPCDSVEDPIISSNYACSGSNSVKISYFNDLVKPLGNYTSGMWFILFHVYIPSGKAGYFNLLSGFTPDPYEWAMECFFDPGGQGYINAGGMFTGTFSFSYDTWQMVLFSINLDIDEAQFWFNGNLIHSWQWTLGVFGGGSALKLAANSFFGWPNTAEMYIDDFLIKYLCLGCPRPLAPSNLTAQLILNPDPQVQLNWQDNSSNEYNFNILRKIGFPNNPGEYELIGYVGSNTTRYIDQDVITDSTYTYVIRAYNLNGYSDTSNAATITIDTFLVEIEIEVFESLTFILEQNYPNPFNPTTNIKYSIPQSSYVRLAVYNLVGEEVVLLVNGQVEVGVHEVTFNASNLPSGAYFYKLQSQNSVEVKKMLLTK